jgi:antiviral helicase SLH1
MTGQADIVSKFQSKLLDNLNAEISRGTVSTITEAVEWLRYTYFYVRLRKNPVEYGLSWKQLGNNPDLAFDIYLNDLCAVRLKNELKCILIF